PMIACRAPQSWTCPEPAKGRAKGSLPESLPYPRPLTSSISERVPKNGTALPRLVDDVVNQPVLLALLRIHDEIALHVLFHLVQLLAAVAGQDLVDDLAHAQDLARVNVNVGGLPAQPAHDVRLVDENARVWQRKALLGRPRCQQHRSHACRLPDADRHHVRLDVLHGVVHRHARGDRAARRIDVKLNVFFRILGRQEQHLRDHQVGHGVVDGRAQKNNVVPQQPAVNVVGAFAAPGLLNDHRYQHDSCFPFTCPGLRRPLSSACSAGKHGVGREGRKGSALSGPEKKPTSRGADLHEILSRAAPAPFHRQPGLPGDLGGSGLDRGGQSRPIPARRRPASGGAAVEQVQGFVVAEAAAHALERAFPGQASTHAFDRLARLFGQRLHLALDFLVGDLDVLALGDAVQQERSLDLAHGGIALAGAQAGEVHALHVLGSHALRGEGAQAALQAEVNLSFYERFRNLEIVPPDQLVQDLLFALALRSDLLATADVLAKLGTNLLHASDAEFLRPRVVQFGQLLALDRLDLHGIIEALAGEALIGEIGRVLNVEGALFTGTGAAQVFRELGQRAGAGDLNQNVSYLDGFGILFADGSALERDLGEVAVGERPLL